MIPRRCLTPEPDIRCSFRLRNNELGGHERRWSEFSKLRDLFCEEFSEDILRSIAFTSELERDIQIFVDENPKAVVLSELPPAPFLKAVWIYGVSRNFRHPQVCIPLRNESRCVLGGKGVSYNNLFRAVAITFHILPAFKIETPDNISEIPTLGGKRDQVLRLGAALMQTQVRCVGKVNGEVLRGVDFLSRLAKNYGVHVTFNDQKRGKGKGESTQSKVKARMFRKFERFHRDEEVLVPFLRRYVSASQDLSSFLLEKEWAVLSEGNPNRLTIRESLSAIIKNCSSNDWFSLYKEVLLRED